jgi:phosphate/sulfate permease
VVSTVRAVAAKVIMWVAVLAAFALGLGALLVGFGANPHNTLVSFVVGVGHRIDGPFGDLFTFHDQVKQILVNWVIAAVVYLAVGGILARLVRP